MPAAQPDGATRQCPHCKATILQSASVCPGCRHHLRFDPAASQASRPTVTALRIEGSLPPAASAGPVEYSVIVSVRDPRGAVVARHVVGVGAMRPGEGRSFVLEVETSGTPEKKHR
jgi:hypothetical protein